MGERGKTGDKLKFHKLERQQVEKDTGGRWWIGRKGRSEQEFCENLGGKPSCKKVAGWGTPKKKGMRECTVGVGSSGGREGWGRP